MIVWVDKVNVFGLCLAGDGMLTQEPTPDPKCKLNITSFFTFPHPLDCLICAKDIMIIVLLKMMGGMGRLGVVYLC